MTITPINPGHFPWYDHKRYSFSLGLKTSAGTYLSGHTASEYEAATMRMVVRGGMTEQARTVYAKVAAILEGGGLGYGDVSRIVEYVRPEGIERYAEAAAVRAELFGGYQPVVNTVPVKSLLRSDAFIEIEVSAAAAPGVGPSSVFLPSVQPVDDQGNILGAGDLVVQTKVVYDRAARMLSALGIGLDRVVKTATYITPRALPDYENALRVRHERLGPVFPAAVDIVMPRLLHPQAVVQCDFIATHETPVAVNPGWKRYDGLACSPAVRAGKLLYMSGQGALDPTTGRVLHKGDVVAQAEYVYNNVLQLVRLAGGEPRHLVKTIEYVTPASLEHYREVSGLRSKMLQEPRPASTGLISEALLQPGMRIDVDALAVLD
ncbi:MULTISPECIES: RidA family protein [unclassified Bradyrhizobium]|uniref:RidA family protein n=1 Tax=unclassified Bradyrhizobium TaxID=2631580 RepID=UPI00247A59D5|nr:MULTISPECIES: RidA family protein [unclassified Bradyrhizobium]WGS19226.1 Rid family hydrolase [Bradyrhizobium sp. ISRA463]WGS26063.1 Rid family hydrolase [Bradyrhizobium sp. ISRA464]